MAVARKVVGVGSVGTRAWVLLMVGTDGTDPLLLQAKEAQESVMARFVGASRYANQIEHVYVDHRPLAEEIRAANDRLAGQIAGALKDNETPAPR